MRIEETIDHAAALLTILVVLALLGATLVDVIRGTL